MVSLLDVLSLPSCGWSSKENIIKKEVLRGFGRITSGTGVLINQDAFNTIISTFIEKFRRRRMGRDKFIHHEKTWLENQQLLVRFTCVYLSLSKKFYFSLCLLFLLFLLLLLLIFLFLPA